MCAWTNLFPPSLSQIVLSSVILLCAWGLWYRWWHVSRIVKEFLLPRRSFILAYFFLYLCLQSEAYIPNTDCLSKLLSEKQCRTSPQHLRAIIRLLFTPVPLQRVSGNIKYFRIFLLGMKWDLALSNLLCTFTCLTKLCPHIVSFQH